MVLMQLIIDQTQCFNEMGLKTAYAFMRDRAQKSHRRCLEGIAARAQEGNFLARIEDNPNGIPAVAKRKLDKDLQLTVVTMPRSRPVIEFVDGALKTKFIGLQQNGRIIDKSI
jgi:hypothetical protein